MRIPIIAGAVAFAAQAGASAGGVSESKITELLLAALVAMAIYIARETHRHGICLFGAKGNPDDNGISGKLHEMEKWRADTAEELRQLHEDAEDMLDEIREHHEGARSIPRHRRRSRALPK